MKRIYLLACLFVCLSAVSAQETKPDAHSPYVFPAFQKGVVYFLNGDSSVRSMNYNGVTEEMVYLESGKMLAIDHPETISRILLGETTVFEPVNGKFCQRLADYGNGLYVSFKYTVLPPSSPSAYGSDASTTASTNWSHLEGQSMLYELSLPSDYKLLKVKQYTLYVDQKPYKVNRSIVKQLFPDKANSLKTYEKKHKLNLKDPEDVRTFIGICYGKMPTD